MAAGAEAAGVILQQMELAGGGVRLSLPAGTVSDRLLNLKQTGAVRTGGKILGMEPEQRQEKSVKILVAPGKLQRSGCVTAGTGGPDSPGRLRLGADAEKTDEKHDIIPPLPMIPCLPFPVKKKQKVAPGRNSPDGRAAIPTGNPHLSIDRIRDKR